MRGDSAAQAYATALAAGRPQDIASLLRVDASFQSPFSLWEDPGAVAAAFSARCRAFRDVRVEQVLEDGDNAVVRWRARVAEAAVEGCDALTLVGGRVLRVDVFLRPAAVLPAVHAAMSAAWPVGRTTAGRPGQTGGRR